MAKTVASRIFLHGVSLFLRRIATPRYSVLSGRKPGTSFSKMAKTRLPAWRSTTIVPADTLEFPALLSRCMVKGQQREGDSAMACCPNKVSYRTCPDPSTEIACSFRSSSRPLSAVQIRTVIPTRPLHYAVHSAQLSITEPAWASNVQLLILHVRPEPSRQSKDAQRTLRAPSNSPR